MGSSETPVSDENYTLRLNDVEKKYAETFRALRNDEFFTDVTLVAFPEFGSPSLSHKAHRLILSASSPYFHSLLKSHTPWQHPILVLQDVKASDLDSLLDFIYYGQVHVHNEALPSFLSLAQKLRIKGLSEFYSEVPTGSSGLPALRASLSGPPTAHQSHSKIPRMTSAEEPLMYVSPSKRQKFTSLLRTQLIKESSPSSLSSSSSRSLGNGEDIKTEPMTILSSEDIPSSGVNVTEFIASHEEGDLIPSLSSHSFLFSPEPSSVSHGISHSVSNDKASDSHHHHSHHSHSTHLHHELTTPPSTSSSNGSSGSSLSSSGQLVQSEPQDLTPTTPSSQLDDSSLNESPTHPKKDRNSRKTCPYCHKDFHEMSLKRHIKDVHFRNQNTYVICPQCCKQYASQNSLYSHLNRVHGVKKDMMDTIQLQVVTGQTSGSNGSNDGLSDLTSHHSDSSNG